MRSLSISAGVRAACVLCAGLLGAGLSPQAAAATLDDVKRAGAVKCGITQGLPGFSARNDAGDWRGLDVDYCRALAAAIFGDAGKVRYVPLSSKERFTALQTGEIDVLSRATTWTLSRDAGTGLSFAGIMFYDGQGFMTRKSLNLKDAKPLSEATICANTGTTTELNVADYFRRVAGGRKFELVTFEKSDEALKAYEAGRCDAYTTDHSGLAAQRLKLAKPAEHVVLPDTISKEPLGPAVRDNDVHWFKIARWVLYALINAEELGLTRANVDQKLTSKDPRVRRFLGVDGDFGARLKLRPRWAYNVISKVGNYGEIHARHVGPQTPLGLRRGRNALWTQGGLLYAPPVR